MNLVPSVRAWLRRRRRRRNQDSNPEGEASLPAAKSPLSMANQEGEESMPRQGSLLATVSSFLWRFIPKSQPSRGSDKNTPGGCARVPLLSPPDAQLSESGMPRRLVHSDPSTESSWQRQNSAGGSSISGSSFSTARTSICSRASHHTVLANNLLGGLAGLGVQRPADSVPKPFQCTFCLSQCNGRQEWVVHENGHTLDVPGDRPLRDRCDDCPPSRAFNGYRDVAAIDNIQTTWKTATNMDRWYWNCGFCSATLGSLDERREHIGDHFDEGMTMSSWDPLVSTNPIHNSDFDPAIGFSPCWSPATLLAIQQPGMIDYINR
jgi:hypothetical protein